MTGVDRGLNGEWSGRRASVVGIAFAVTVLGVALFGHGRLINGDGDLARHLVTGRAILRHGPRFADPFSFTRPGESFLAYEWLSQATDVPVLEQ